MSWEQILGFFTMWPHPGTTIILWAKGGVPVWQTILYVGIMTSASLTLTYFGTGWLQKFLIRKKILKESTIKKLQNLWPLTNGNGNSRITKKITNWISRQKIWLILICGFIPFVPILPTAVIIAAGLLKIKYSYPVLLLGNILKTVIICYTIYYSTGSFS